MADGVGLDEVVGEEVFPGIDGLGGDEGGFAGEGVGLPDDEGVLLVEAGGAEELGPVEAGGVGGEVGGVPGVVGFVDVFAVGEGELLLWRWRSRGRGRERRGRQASVRPARRNMAAMWVWYLARMSFMLSESER